MNVSFIEIVFNSAVPHRDWEGNGYAEKKREEELPGSQRMISSTLPKFQSEVSLAHNS